MEPQKPDDRQEQFDRWALAYHEALAAGSRATPLPEPPADPPLQERAREVQGCLEMLERVWPRALPRTTAEGPEGVSRAPGQAGGMPDAVGRFRLVEELGRGGFGIVFRAHDPRLGRDVALKVPRGGTLVDAEQRQRFVWEAQAAAGLSHPNVVPVHEAGEAGAVPYIASEYCPGPSLASWLARNGRPADPRAAARLTASLAGALHYVHSRNVLHRDLKPGNILLALPPGADPEGPPAMERSLDELVPRLTDFGLAKVLQRPGDQTRSGTVLGTPAYMAPEQVRGQLREVGWHTDVYALGVILYELLTGRPPFTGESEQEVREQILGREPPAPSRLARGVPRDLETICLKCLQKEPQKRYASAEELAADLGRFLGGEPIRARPVGLAERAWRWCRRHPAGAGLLAAVPAFLLIVAVVSVVSAWRIADSRDAEREAHARSKRALEDTFAAVDTYFTQVSESPELKEHTAEELRHDLLEKARQFYEEFVERYGDDPERRALLAVAHGRLGAIALEVGSREEVIRHAGRGRDLLESLVREGRATPAHRAHLCVTYHVLAIAYRETGRPREALDACERAREVNAELLAEDPEEEKHLLLCGRIHGSLGLTLRALGQPAEAEGAYREALRVYGLLLARKPADITYLREKALVHSDLGVLYRWTGRADRALAEYEEARKVRTRLVERQPGSPTNRHDLATSDFNLGNLYLLKLGRPQEAQAAFARALRLQEPLVREHPLIHRYRYALAKTQGSLGILHELAGRRAEAGEAYRRALALQEELVRQNPDVTEYVHSLGVTYARLGGLVQDEEHVEEKLELFAKAIPLLRKVLAVRGGRGHLRGDLFQLYKHRASMLLGLGRYEEVVREVDEGLDTAPEAGRPGFLLKRALALAYLGRHARAAREVRALAALPEIPAENLFELACALSLSAAAAREDGALPAEERDTLADRYGREALALLVRARNAGFFKDPNNVKRLKEDPRLIPLRAHAEFATLLQPSEGGEAREGA